MVAIKDMEKIPSCCLWDCPLAREDGGACQLADVRTSYNERPSDCPLVEIEERKVGKWIYDKASQNWRCSVCNETPKTLGYVGTSEFMTEHFKFCNHCGAKIERCENG